MHRNYSWQSHNNHHIAKWIVSLFTTTYFITLLSMSFDTSDPSWLLFFFTRHPILSWFSFNHTGHSLSVSSSSQLLNFGIPQSNPQVDSFLNLPSLSRWPHLIPLLFNTIYVLMPPKIFMSSTVFFPELVYLTSLHGSPMGISKS